MKTLLKWCAVIGAMALLFGAWPITAAGAEQSGDFEYEIDDGKAIITRYLGSDTVVDIPATVGGYPVTVIGNAAFIACTEMTAVTIPDGVTTLENAAFYGCSMLDEIHLPDSLIWIGSEVFDYTYYYDNPYNWEEGLLYIGKYLIKANSREISTSCQLKPGTRVIAAGAFELCDDMQSVIVSEGLIGIGESAFKGCECLALVILPGSVTAIGGGAFEGTAYYEYPGNWEDGALYIGPYLIEVKGEEIPAHYNVRPGTKTIAEGAFISCGEMRSLLFPASVTNISPWVFQRCRALRHVYYGGTKEDREQLAIDIGNDRLSAAVWHYGATAPVIMAGDMDESGVLNMDDAFTLYRAMSGQITLSEAQTRAADMNGDEIVNMADAFALYREVAGQ